MSVKNIKDRELINEFRESPAAFTKLEKIVDNAIAHVLSKYQWLEGVEPGIIDDISFQASSKIIDRFLSPNFELQTSVYAYASTTANNTAINRISSLAAEGRIDSNYRFGGRFVTTNSIEAIQESGHYSLELIAPDTPERHCTSEELVDSVSAWLKEKTDFAFDLLYALINHSPQFLKNQSTKGKHINVNELVDHLRARGHKAYAKMVNDVLEALKAELRVLSNELSSPPALMIDALATALSRRQRT